MTRHVETRATWGSAISAIAARAMFILCKADVSVAPRTRLSGDSGRPTLDSFLKPPIIRRWTASLLSQGTTFRIETLDQPGRWMSDDQLQSLHSGLRHVAKESMNGKIPTHYLLCGGTSRTALSNRIVSIVYLKDSLVPIAFTAMVYLPFNDDVILHLGLTMISSEFRGRRIQSQLMSRCLRVSMCNLFRVQYTITNVAASPAGIGACCDYFLDVFPNYKVPHQLPSVYHQSVAQHLLLNFRYEFACSALASFDGVTFVVRRSNSSEGGGAPEFIKTDGTPVSQHKRGECNAFCASLLDLTRGDELLQVGQVNIFCAWMKYLLSSLLA